MDVQARREVSGGTGGRVWIRVLLSAVVLKALAAEVPPRFTTDEAVGEVIVREGSIAELVCHATGNPTPTVTWFRKPQTVGQRTERIGVSSELFIFNVTRYCGGTYECVAENGVPPSVRREVNVRVQFEPEITLPNQSISQYLGKDTVLECVVSAYPQAVTMWKFRGQPITNSDKYVVNLHQEPSTTIVTLSLFIKNLEMSDFGNYSCIASNSLGETNRKMTLSENERTKPTSTTTTTPATTTTPTTTTTEAPPHPDNTPLADRRVHEDGLEGGVGQGPKVPPMFTADEAVGEVIVREGSIAELVCNVIGNPTPTVTWFRKPQTVGQRTKRVGVSGEVLVIHNVTRYYGGTYECVAENGVPPSVRREVNVRVQFEPEITLPNQSISQYLGKDTVLECVVSAYPQAVTMWKFRGQPITNSDKYVVNLYQEPSTTIVTLSLFIKNLETSDFGNYSCIASNSLGKTNKKMTLSEYERTKPTSTTTTMPATTTTPTTTTTEAPPYPDNTPLADRRVHEDGLEGGEGQGPKVPPRFTTDEAVGEVIVREGSIAELVCNAIGNPTPTVTWFRKPQTVGQRTKRVGVSGEVLVIHNVTRYYGGTYECVAENGVPPSVRREVNVRVQFEPEITLPNQSISQYLGKDTILECVVSAYPQAVTMWKFRGQPITNSDKYVVNLHQEPSTTIVTLSLFIKNLETSDFGNYSCIASNSLGETSKKMTLSENERTKPTSTTTTMPATTTTPTTTTTEAPPYPDNTPLADRRVHEDGLEGGEGQGPKDSPSKTRGTTGSCSLTMPSPLLQLFLLTTTAYFLFTGL